jgi:SiaC family regulatory phosphoprotein
MENYYIESTLKTPLVDLNPMTGELIFSGRSIPENAGKLYEEVLKWVDEYILSPRQTTNLRFNLEYFNTASAIWITKIVKSLCSIKENENTLIIHMYFDIEEFLSMDAEDLKDELHPLIYMIGTPTINLAIKIYGTNVKGEILKESMVLI